MRQARHAAELAVCSSARAARASGRDRPQQESGGQSAQHSLLGDWKLCRMASSLLEWQVKSARHLGQSEYCQPGFRTARLVSRDA
jgi:hypothetical protein